MRLIQRITDFIKRYIIANATNYNSVEIVEARTKQIGLLSVLSETDIRIRNTFFLPFTILSIRTELLNIDGIKVGRMAYDTPIKIKGKSEAILTTQSEISIITSLFQALSNLLSHPIRIKSVGIATIKILWFTIELPVNDDFEIQPSKVKIIREKTEEEKALQAQKDKERAAQRLIKENEKAEQRLIKEAEKRQRDEERKIEKEQTKQERELKRMERRSNRKEAILKRRHKENYIPKELRQTQQTDQEITPPEVDLPVVKQDETVIENPILTTDDVKINSTASTTLPPENSTQSDAENESSTI